MVEGEGLSGLSLPWVSVASVSLSVNVGLMMCTSQEPGEKKERDGP